MNTAIQFWEQPSAKEIVMIAGWRQWADAGAISSGLPQYLVEQTNAQPIGEILPDGFYLFQIPGTHHLLRPLVQLEDGRLRHLSKRQNRFYYTGNEEKGLVIFLGDEPHLDIDRYAATFFAAAKQLGVSRIASLGGVYGPVPYDKDREIGCLYSLPSMRAELENYALQFSSYEGGASMSSYLVSQAEQVQMPFQSFYGFVPNYDFSQMGANGREVRIEHDYKAWYDIMRRLNRLFGLAIGLTDLERKSDQLLQAMEEQLEDIVEKVPQLNVRELLAQISRQFVERPFAPLDDIWAEGLADLFSDPDDEPG